MISQKTLRFIIPYLEMGGTERHLSYLLPALAERGWKIKLLVLSENLPLKDLFNHPNITLKGLPPLPFLNIFPKSLRNFFQTLHLLLKDFLNDRHTLTHFFLPKAYCLGMICAKLCRLKAPLIMSRRSLNFYQKRHKILYLERLLHRFCSLILVNSAAIKNQLTEEEHVREDHIFLIYNGLPEEIFLHHQNPSPKKDSSCFQMVTLGNLIPYKGHKDLLNALSLIKSDLGETWHLTVIGQDRGHLSYLKTQAYSLGIAKHITWISSCTDPKPYLLNADLGLLPSHEEGFSNALLEMMAMGLPIIATQVGGNVEALEEGKSGLLVPPQSPQALKDGILSLFYHPNLRKFLGKQAKKRFLAFFTLSQCVQKYEQVYTLISSQKNDTYK